MESGRIDIVQSCETCGSRSLTTYLKHVLVRLLWLSRVLLVIIVQVLVDRDVLDMVIVLFLATHCKFVGLV